MNSILTLSDQLIIGKGRDRICFAHPEFRDLCIKVALRPEKQTRREKRYFHYLKQKCKDLGKLAPYLGKVETNLGSGAVFPRVLNDDGTPAHNLTYAIRNGLLNDTLIDAQLVTLKQYLLDNAICVRDVSPSNIMCKEYEQGYNFMLVDGVTNPGINPLNVRIKYLARRSVRSAWPSLERKVNRLRKEREHSAEK